MPTAFQSSSSMQFCGFAGSHWSEKGFAGVSEPQAIARTISAAIWARSVGAVGQKRGGTAAWSQPLITPRAARASMAAQAGSAAGTSPKRWPQGDAEGLGEGLGEGTGGWYS